MRSNISISFRAKSLYETRRWLLFPPFSGIWIRFPILTPTGFPHGVRYVYKTRRKWGSAAAFALPPNTNHIMEQMLICLSIAPDRRPAHVPSGQGRASARRHRLPAYRSAAGALLSGAAGPEPPFGFGFGSLEQPWRATASSPRWRWALSPLSSATSSGSAPCGAWVAAP